MKEEPFASCPFSLSNPLQPRTTRSSTKIAKRAQQNQNGDFPGELCNNVNTPSHPKRGGRGGRRGLGRVGCAWPSQSIFQQAKPKTAYTETTCVAGIASTVDSAPPEVIPIEVALDSPIKEGNVTQAVLRKIVVFEERQYTEKTANGNITEIISQSQTIKVDIKDKKRVRSGSEVYVPSVSRRSNPEDPRTSHSIPPEPADDVCEEIKSDFAARGYQNSFSSRSTSSSSRHIPRDRISTSNASHFNLFESTPKTACLNNVTAGTTSLNDAPTVSIGKLDLVDEPKWPTTRAKPVTKYHFKIDNMDELMINIQTPFIDSHCHLDFIYARVKRSGGRYLDEWKKVYKDAFPKNFLGCIPNFIEPDLWYDRGIGHTDIPWIRKQMQSPLVLGATYGVHPHEANKYTDHVEKNLREILTLPEFKPIAVGECGLDAQNGLATIKVEQYHPFERQVIIAKELDLPIVIHCRGPNIDDDYLVEKKCLEIMKKAGLSRWHSIHRHCFKVDYTAYDMWTRSFPNTFFGITPLTGPIDEGLKIAIEKIPLDRLLLETDSPYFRPRQFDLSANAGPVKCALPGMAICAAAIIAQIKKIDVEKVLEATEKNTRRCYGLYDHIVE